MDAEAEAAAAELRLRLRVEELLALHREAPAADVVEALDALEAAALALVGAGVVDAAHGHAIVAEAVDALVARGASWLAPALPDLDVTRLYEATAGGGRPQLRRVVGVATTLPTGTITSVELWSDRAVARVVDADGAVAASHVVGAAGVDDRRLDLRDGAGGVVSVDLAGGRVVREVPGVLVPADVARHLDALVALEAAVASSASSAGAAGLAVLNGARARLAAAVEALDPAQADAALGRFDAAVVAAPDPIGAPLLLEVVPVAQRFFGGWLTSIEAWSDHWRAVVVPEDGAVAVAKRWTARAGDHRFGGVALADDVVRFEGALPLDWSVVVLEGHGAGDVLELEVRR